MARREVTGRKQLTNFIERDSRSRDPDDDEPPPPPRLAVSILEFCDAFSISEGMYYKLKKQGLGPREMKVGTRTLISMEAADEWRRERERSTAADA